MKKKKAPKPFFSKNTRKLLDLKKKVLPPSKNFVPSPLPKRLNNFEIIKTVPEFRSHDDTVYLLKFKPSLEKDKSYLIYHFSKDDDKCVTFLFWDEIKWHFSTLLPEFKSDSFPGWNEGIIVLQ